MKIDVFSHFMPKNYLNALREKALPSVDVSELGQWVDSNPALTQVDIRLRVMERYPEVVQVLTMATPPLETVVSPEDAVELSRLGNNELAEIISNYPNRFVAGVATLPLNDIAASLEEAERAIKKLNFRGIQVFTNINGEGLHEAKFRPILKMMAQYDLPIWIHPWDLPTATLSKHSQEWLKGPMVLHGLRWPFETSVAMVRLIESGIFEEFPTIRFITHHCGGMMPFFGDRIGGAPALKNFYGDTALYGNTPALMCGLAWFGSDRLLFGTDMPLGASKTGSYGRTLDTIQAIETMDLTDADRRKIFLDNARLLLKILI
jgi:predicted TIM-barrel fold metal-dependent hydrolase